MQMGGLSQGYMSLPFMQPLYHNQGGGMGGGHMGGGGHGSAASFH